MSFTSSELKNITAQRYFLDGRMLLVFIPPSDIIEFVVRLVATGRGLHGDSVRRSAVNWPLAQGTIGHVRLSSQQRGMEKLPGISMSYYYTVGGEFYGGSVELPFPDEGRAREFVNLARRTPIKVSVRPNKPEESTITQEQLELAESALLGSAQSTLDEQSNFAFPTAVRWLLKILMWAAALGVVVFMVIHLAAIAGRALVSFRASLVFALCPILLLLPLRLERKAAQEAGSRRKPAPSAVTYAVYFFLIVYVGYGVAAGLLPQAVNPTFKLQVVASIGELFYTSVLAYLYPLTQARKASNAVIAAGSLAGPRA